MSKTLPERLRDAARKLRTSSMPLSDFIPLLQQAADYIEAQGVPDVDSLTDAIAEGLRGTYHCTRVWEAWHVGTMDQDDFEPVDESDTPRELAETVIAMLAAAPPAPQASLEQQEPMFWVRLCSNGMYEGPLHDKQLEDVRRHSGAWTPLYTNPAQQAKPQPLSDGQINQMWSDAHNDTSPMSMIHVLARAIEAAHGIKE